MTSFKSEARPGRAARCGGGTTPVGAKPARRADGGAPRQWGGGAPTRRGGVPRSAGKCLCRSDGDGKRHLPAERGTQGGGEGPRKRRGGGLALPPLGEAAGSPAGGA